MDVRFAFSPRSTHLQGGKPGSDGAKRRSKGGKATTTSKASRIKAKTSNSSEDTGASAHCLYEGRHQEPVSQLRDRQDVGAGLVHYRSMDAACVLGPTVRSQRMGPRRLHGGNGGNAASAHAASNIAPRASARSAGHARRARADSKALAGLGLGPTAMSPSPAPQPQLFAARSAARRLVPSTPPPQQARRMHAGADLVCGMRIGGDARDIPMAPCLGDASDAGPTAAVPPVDKGPQARAAYPSFVPTAEQGTSHLIDSSGCAGWHRRQTAPLPSTPSPKVSRPAASTMRRWQAPELSALESEPPLPSLPLRQHRHGQTGHAPWHRPPSEPLALASASCRDVLAYRAWRTPTIAATAVAAPRIVSGDWFPMSSWAGGRPPPPQCPADAEPCPEDTAERWCE